MSVATKSGHQQPARVGVLLPQPGRVQRAAGLLRPGQARREHEHHGRHRRRSDPQEPPVLLRRLGAQPAAPEPLRPVHRADREDARGRLQRGAGVQPELPHLRPEDGQSRRPAPAARPSPARSFRPIASAASPSRSRRMYPAPNNAGTNNGLQNNLFAARFPEATRDNYDGKVNWNRTSAHQIWAKYSMMDASVQDLFYLPVRGRRWRRHQDLPRHDRQHVDPQPDADPRRQRRVQHHEARVAGPRLRHQLRQRRLRHPGHQRPGRHRQQRAEPRAAQRHARVQYRSRRARQQRDVDAGRARRTELHGVDQSSPRWPGATRSARASTSCASSSPTGSRRLDNPRGAAHVRGRHSPASPGTPASAAGTPTRGSCSARSSSYSKSVQFEELTGRENQFGVYINDRWQVNEKLTLNLGLRYENYPLMTPRRSRHRSARRRHVQRGPRRPRRQLRGPRDEDQQHAVRAAPRRGLPHRRQHASCVPASAGRSTRCRGPGPIRGRYPAIIAYSEPGSTASSRTAACRSASPPRRIRTSSPATSSCRAAL